MNSILSALCITMFGFSAFAQNEVVRIMPLGDSITFGTNYDGGYRVKLEKLLAGENITARFVGSMSNGSNGLKSRANEGHPGWKINDLAKNVDGWMKKSNPQIVLLMIGTNDLWVRKQGDTHSVTLAVSQLDSLIEKIFLDLPKCRLIVASIPPANTTWNWNAYVMDYNSHIKALVNTRAAKGELISFADIYADLSFQDLADGVHPTPVGYNKMADVWFSAIIR